MQHVHCLHQVMAILGEADSCVSWIFVTRHMLLLLHLSGACCCRYGGVVERPNIAAQADWYIYDIQTLLQALLEPA